MTSRTRAHQKQLRPARSRGPAELSVLAAIPEDEKGEEPDEQKVPVPPVRLPPSRPVVIAPIPPPLTTAAMKACIARLKNGIKPVLPVQIFLDGNLGRAETIAPFIDQSFQAEFQRGSSLNDTKLKNKDVKRLKSVWLEGYIANPATRDQLPASALELWDKSFNDTGLRAFVSAFVRPLIQTPIIASMTRSDLLEVIHAGRYPYMSWDDFNKIVAKFLLNNQRKQIFVGPVPWPVLHERFNVHFEITDIQTPTNDGDDCPSDTSGDISDDAVDRPLSKGGPGTKPGSSQDPLKKNNSGSNRAAGTLPQIPALSAADETMQILRQIGTALSAVASGSKRRAASSLGADSDSDEGDSLPSSLYDKEEKKFRTLVKAYRFVNPAMMCERRVKELKLHEHTRSSSRLTVSGSSISIKSEAGQYTYDKTSWDDFSSGYEFYLDTLAVLPDRSDEITDRRKWMNWLRNDIGITNLRARTTWALEFMSENCETKLWMPIVKGSGTQLFNRLLKARDIPASSSSSYDREQSKTTKTERTQQKPSAQARKHDKQKVRVQKRKHDDSTEPSSPEDESDKTGDAKVSNHCRSRQRKAYGECRNSTGPAKCSFSHACEGLLAGGKDQCGGDHARRYCPYETSNLKLPEPAGFKPVGWFK